MPQSKAITNAASHLSVLCESDVWCIQCSSSLTTMCRNFSELLSYRWLSTNIKFFPLCVKNTLWGKQLWKLLIQLLWLTRHRIGQQQKIYKKNGMEFELKNILQWIQRKERKKGRKRRDEKTVLFSYISVPTVLALIPSPSTWKWRLGHYCTKVK